MAIARKRSRMSQMNDKPDKKLGLCLAGGGGVGFLHIGLFHAMEELGIRPGIIAGTSSGAVFGAFYAAGKTASEMEDLFRNFKWARIVAPTIPRRGFVSTVRMQSFYRSMFGEIDIADLPMKLKVAAVDINSGELVAFTKGPLDKCLSASCAVPGIFEPVTIDGRTYYDAGGIYNLPLELLSGEHLDTIIAGNTIGEFGLMQSPKTVQDMLYQAYFIRSAVLTKWRTGEKGWQGRKNERLVMIDYKSKGISPTCMADCAPLIEETKHLSLSVLRKAFPM